MSTKPDTAFQEFQDRIFAALDAVPGPRCAACGSNRLQPLYRDVVHVFWHCRACGHERLVAPPPPGADT